MPIKPPISLVFNKVVSLTKSWNECWRGKMDYNFVLIVGAVIFIGKF